LHPTYDQSVPYITWFLLQRSTTQNKAHVSKETGNVVCFLNFATNICSSPYLLCKFFYVFAVCQPLLWWLWAVGSLNCRKRGRDPADITGYRTSNISTGNQRISSPAHSFVVQIKRIRLSRVKGRNQTKGCIWGQTPTIDPHH